LPMDDTSARTINMPSRRESLSGFVDTVLKSGNPAGIYPEGPFSVNDARCIYAKAGISLLSVSNQYQIPLSRLMEFNDMNQEDVLNNDQLIFLQRKRKIGFTAFHIVQPGESMYTICQTEGIRYESILELNHLKAGQEPVPGEKIYLQTMANGRPVLAVNAKSAGPSS
jgi:LysM repeat protein